MDSHGFPGHCSVEQQHNETHLDNVVVVRCREDDASVLTRQFPWAIAACCTVYDSRLMVSTKVIGASLDCYLLQRRVFLYQLLERYPATENVERAALNQCHFHSRELRSPTYLPKVKSTFPLESLFTRSRSEISWGGFEHGWGQGVWGTRTFCSSCIRRWYCYPLAKLYSRLVLWRCQASRLRTLHQFLVDALA